MVKVNTTQRSFSIRRNYTKSLVIVNLDYNDILLITILDPYARFLIAEIQTCYKYSPDKILLLSCHLSSTKINQPVLENYKKTRVYLCVLYESLKMHITLLRVWWHGEFLTPLWLTRHSSFSLLHSDTVTDCLLYN